MIIDAVLSKEVKTNENESPGVFTIPGLLIITASAIGCGTKSNPIISQLPSSKQTQINKTLNGSGDYEIRRSLPFKPRHGTASLTYSLNIKRPVNQLTLKLYNNAQSLIIHESTAGGTIPNLPNGLKLADGLPAEFKQVNGRTELSWSNSKVFFQLDAQPALPKKELLQIADSMG